jgi:hypothetical protein
MALTRFQSVLEILEEEDFFMSSGSSKRDHVDAIRHFRVDNGNRDTTKKSQRNEALLAVREPVVFVRHGGSAEYSLCVRKVKPMISKVRLSLSLVPRDTHLRSVYTTEPGVNHARAAL